MKQKEIELYKKIVQDTALLSSAEIAKVGAIIVKDRNIISFGYNGTYAGEDNCCEHYVDGVLKSKPNVIHAEKNAIMKVCKSNNSTQDATIFVTHEPCQECASLIALSGIKEVYYINDYVSKNFGSGANTLKQLGIKVNKLD